MTTETLLSSPVTDLLGPTDPSSGRRRASCLASDVRTVERIMASIQGADHYINAELQQAIVAEALKKKIRHRQRCRKPGALPTETDAPGESSRKSHRQTEIGD
ncbi:hypothetical protein GN958_ATG03279 [Phytophthora infestans]|uniref:Uncharacterized protein n=1 Tax=Phytophthora infestans TaxID=4787 RepID=A0A8S9V8I5_PHYIN|nr:hypothetical protein GN958_ATG03279 [Phytophthora infestans]